MTEDIRYKIEQLIKSAESSIPLKKISHLPPGKYTSGQPKWHDFEHCIWKSGEEIRLLLLKKKSLRNDAELQAPFARISTNRNGKRGRQSFIILLGYKCCKKHAAVIASQLDDPNVVGHVIDTLLKMQVPDFVHKIRAFINHEVTWIRNKAKTYCKRYGDMA